MTERMVGRALAIHLRGGIAQHLNTTNCHLIRFRCYAAGLRARRVPSPKPSRGMRTLSFKGAQNDPVTPLTTFSMTEV